MQEMIHSLYVLQKYKKTMRSPFTSNLLIWTLKTKDQDLISKYNMRNYLK